MSQASTIEWTDATWNPVTGCDRVSPGCKHCYARDLAARLKAMGQKRYQRADHLRATPAAVRFISAEPLLGPLVLPTSTLTDGWIGKPRLNLEGIDWLIVGGESGPKARPMDPQWVRDLRDQCLLVDAAEHEFTPGDDAYPLPELRRPAFFFKQWGGRTPKAGGRELDGRTWDEFPEPRQTVPA